MPRETSVLAVGSLESSYTSFNQTSWSGRGIVLKTAGNIEYRIQICTLHH